MTRREGGAARVAAALKSAPPALDDLARARMEKRLVDALRSEGARSERHERDRVEGDRVEGDRMEGDRIEGRRRDRRGRAAWAAGGALVAAAAALAIGWIVWPREGSGTGIGGTGIGGTGIGGTESGPVARFTIEGPREGASGEVRVGGSLVVGAGERAAVQVGHAAVDLAASSSVRFASLDTRDVRLELLSGEVAVAFHPVERGRERLSVETPSARVEVVGTVFTVHIEDGATRVAVREGTVRVVPRGAQSSAVLVHAGESVAVERDGRAAADTGSGSGSGSGAGAETGAGAATGADSADGATVTAARARARRDEASAPAVAVAAPEPTAEYDPAPAVVERPDVVPVSPQVRLSAARGQIEQGRHAAGRAALAAIVRDRSVPLDVRLEAQTVIAESHQGEGAIDDAIAAYERAAQMGSGRDEGANAIFAIARLHERRGRVDDARTTYLRYLDEAPLGPNARFVRQWICRHGGDPSVACGGSTP